MGKTFNRNFFILATGLILLSFLTPGCVKKQRNNPLDPGSDDYIAPHVPSKVMIWSDNFESYASYSQLTNTWRYVATGGMLDVPAGLGMGGSRALRFSSGQMGQGYAVYRTNEFLSGEFYILVSMRSKGITNTHYNAAFRLRNKSTGLMLMEVGMRAQGTQKLLYYDPGSGRVMTTNQVPRNIWFSFEIKINTSTQRFTASFKREGQAAFSVFADNVSSSGLNGTIRRYELEGLSTEIIPDEEILMDNFELYRFE